MQHIIETSEDVLKEYGSKDIIQTAENSGANVWFRQLGSLKGFYVCENNKRYIVINEELDDNMKVVVCAHELGHDQLHQELAEGGIRETTLFLANNKIEREANLFAANVLLTDEHILDEIFYHNDVNSLSSSLGVPPEIIGYKLEILNYKGYKFNNINIKNDFLK